MARRKADLRELGRALQAPAFRHQLDVGTGDGLAPISPTTLVLSLGEVKPYEHNPRQGENPEFHRLKDSIRARRGLNTPLTVTRRPGETIYTVAAGGNSRLQALRDLYEESGDDNFSRITCQFEPWQCEYRVLANHLIENDVRGNITFADKARSIVLWCEMYEAAHPDRAPLTQRDLADSLGEAGFQVSQTSLNRLLYAAEHLLPHLPRAFDSGLGRDAVERLIRLRVLAERYWREAVGAGGAVEPKSTFNDLFVAVCREQDREREDWAHELFVACLVSHIADAARIDPKLVSLSIDGLRRGISTKANPDPSLERLDGDDAEGWIFAKARRHAKEQADRRLAREEARAQRSEPKAPELGSSEQAVAVPQAMGTTPLAGLKVAREAVVGQARDVAARFGVDHLLCVCDTGYGFFIEPPEPPAAGDPHNRVGLEGAAAWAWWWVASCAQQLDPKHLAAIARSHPDAWLVQLFQSARRYLPDTEARAALEVLVRPVDLARLAHEFLTSEAVSTEDFAALQELMAACRRLGDACLSRASLWD